jgi:hypothetical protein
MARLMQTDTAIGRIQAANDPIRLEVKTATVTRGEPADEFFTRVAQSNPALFGRATEVAERLTAIAARNEAIDVRLKGAPDEATNLQRQLEATTDKRKIKKLQRKIAKAEKDAGKPLGKLAQAEKSQRTKIAREQKRLAKEAAELTTEAAKLAKRTGQAVKKVHAKQVKQQVFVVKQVIGKGTDRTSVKARQTADFATVWTKATEDFASIVARDAARSVPGTPAQPARATDTPVTPDARAAAVPEDTAAIKAKDETVEAQIRALADEAPETKIEVIGEDGSVRTITTKEMLTDLADDETLLKELRSCIAGLA